MRATSEEYLRWIYYKICVESLKSIDDCISISLLLILTLQEQFENETGLAVPSEFNFDLDEDERKPIYCWDIYNKYKWRI